MSDCGLLSGPDVESAITSQLDTVMSYGNTAFTTAMAALNAIKAEFTSQSAEYGVSSGGGFAVTTPEDSSYLFAKPTKNLSEVDEYSPPDVPNFDDSDLEEFYDLLSNITAELLALVGTFPDAPTVDIEDLFLSLLNEYYNTLTGYLKEVLSEARDISEVNISIPNLLVLNLEQLLKLEENGGPRASSIGISATVEQAMRDRGNATIDREEIQALKEANTEWLSRGFDRPTGVLDELLAKARQTANDKRGAINRDVLIEAAKWEIETRRFALEKALTWETMERDTFFKHWGEARAIATTWQENHIKVKMAVVEIYKAQVEAIGRAADALAAAGNAAATAIKARLDALRLYIERYDAQLRGEIARIDAGVKLYDANIRLYGADITAESERVDAVGKQDERTIARERINADVVLKEQEMEMTKLINNAKMAVDAMDAIARTSSQLAAGVYSALHMSAGMSVGTDYRNSSDCQTTYSYSY